MSITLWHIHRAPFPKTQKMHLRPPAEIQERNFELENYLELSAIFRNNLLVSK
jgi:hypothetical protein